MTMVEHSTSKFSATAIATARARGLLRVDDDGLGWIRDMEPDLPRSDAPTDPAPPPSYRAEQVTIPER
jgi:hypothetical protein